MIKVYLRGQLSLKSWNQSAHAELRAARKAGLIGTQLCRESGQVFLVFVWCCQHWGTPNTRPQPTRFQWNST